MKENRLKILITGSKGQLANCIMEKSGYITPSCEFNYFFKNENELDITNKNNVELVLNEINPDIIINCAAYTNVEMAETVDNELAYAVNVDGPKYLAEFCKNSIKNPLLIHVSTDYVFDGNMNTPYEESSPKIPQNQYGKTKLYGEEEIIKSGCNYIILRTSWLYSSNGNNFFKKMINKGLDYSTDEIFAPIDEVSVPTNARNLADAIINICHEYINAENKENLNGVYHYVANGIASRYDFLSAIYEYTKKEFGTNKKITPCSIENFKSNVKRPKYSVMDNSKLKNTFKSVKFYDWRESVRIEIRNMF